MDKENIARKMGESPKAKYLRFVKNSAENPGKVIGEVKFVRNPMRRISPKRVA